MRLKRVFFAQRIFRATSPRFVFSRNVAAICFFAQRRSVLITKSYPQSLRGPTPAGRGNLVWYVCTLNVAAICFFAQRRSVLITKSYTQSLRGPAPAGRGNLVWYVCTLNVAAICFSAQRRSVLITKSYTQSLRGPTPAGRGNLVWYVYTFNDATRCRNYLQTYLLVSIFAPDINLAFMSVTRENILELGESLIRSKGYNAFSYLDISSELGIKNAAIHYYFPTKENLGTSIVRTNIQRFEEMVQNLHSRGFDESRQLQTFIKIYIKSHREKKLCIVGSLGPDYNTLNETTRTELKKMTEMILGWLSGILETGREKGVFYFSGDAKYKAVVVLSALMASLQLTRMLENLDYKYVYQSILEGLIKN
jgi:TetR/AcrR family transcriptional regulator, transcriptional repressor for nem operon